MTVWLMTKYGFYSIVQKQPGVYHVRAREKGDLLRLTRPNGPLPGEQVHQSGRSDYAYRLIVGKVEVQRLLAFLGDTLDYDNFKAVIDSEPSQWRKPYHRVWSLLADALGAYGHRGKVGLPGVQGHWDLLEEEVWE